MKKNFAILVAILIVVLRSAAQVDSEAAESWWLLGQKANTIKRCTEGPRRLRFVDGVVYDLQPLAEYYSIFTNALTSSNQAAMLADLSKWTNGRPLKGWILLTGTIEKITPNDGILMNVRLDPEKEFSDTKLVRVKNVPDLPPKPDDAKLVILARLTGKFSYEPETGEKKEIESWDHGTKPTPAQMAQSRSGANPWKPSPPGAPKPASTNSPAPKWP